MEPNANADEPITSLPSDEAPAEPATAPLAAETPSAEEASPSAADQPAEAAEQPQPAEPAEPAQPSQAEAEAAPEAEPPAEEPSSERSPEEPAEAPETAGETPAEAAAEPQQTEGDRPDQEAAAAESAAEAAAQPGESDPLAELSERALRGRLSPADEEKAAALLKEALLQGREGLGRAIEQLPKLPWVIGVNAVSSAWPEIKPTFRTRLLAGLARIDSDSARRVRLSLARGLFKQDVPAALKIAVNVAKDIRDKQTGVIQPKNAQIFANVFIGRAKPWLAQLPLKDLKPAEADIVVHCALFAAFSLPHAPITQLGILKWAFEAGRLGKVHPAVLEAITKGLSRWSAKWQNVLRKEVPELPEEMAGALKSAPAAAPEAGEPAAEDRAPEDTKDREAEATEQEGQEERKEASEEEEDRGDEEEEEEEDEDEEEEQAARERHAQPQQKQRPVYESKTIPSQQQQKRPQQPGHFNLQETLRQIEQHVAGLRSELASTQGKLRQRDDELRKARRGGERTERPTGPIIKGEPTMDELARLNLQLEARNAELQQRIDDLLADSEDRAASMGVITGEQRPPDEQLRTLLELKLQEDFADFRALEKEAPDIVVQQHYRTVLRHVFEVLQNEGIKFVEPPEQP